MTLPCLTTPGSAGSFSTMAARTRPARRTEKRGAELDAPEGTLRFGPMNGILLGAGLVSIIAGFALLAAGSIVAAPLLLVLGYIVLVPWGIIH